MCLPKEFGALPAGLTAKRLATTIGKKCTNAYGKSHFRKEVYKTSKTNSKTITKTCKTSKTNMIK